MMYIYQVRGDSMQITVLRSFFQAVGLGFTIVISTTLQHLCCFVLEEHVQSKLMPSKTFMMQHSDVDVITKHNLSAVQSELDSVTHELHEVKPLLKSPKKLRTRLGMACTRLLGTLVRISTTTHAEPLHLDHQCNRRRGLW